MKCGYIQFAPHLADVEQTILELKSRWPQVAAADLVVLPELANSGCCRNDLIDDRRPEVYSRYLNP